MKFNFKKMPVALGLVMSVSFLGAKPALAGAEPYVGELMLVGSSFCPRNWLEANGQELAIASYQTLFSLYGTMYGGDGRVSFKLPDLRGRAPIHYGQGPGLNSYRVGAAGGTERFTVTVNNMPSHNHEVQATNKIANKNGPGTDLLAIPSLNDNIYHEGPANKIMDPTMITNTGGGQAIEKRSPYLAMRWCVAMEGIYPPRS